MSSGSRKKRQSAAGTIDGAQPDAAVPSADGDLVTLELAAIAEPDDPWAGIEDELADEDDPWADYATETEGDRA